MDAFDTVAQLTTQNRRPENRVTNREHPSETAAVALAEPDAAVEQPTHERLSCAQEGGELALLGKAMLGISGAYLLRAVAESGTVPKLAVVVLALTYAGLWLVLAARVSAAALHTSAVYATTSTLILAPMLIELTLRFKVLPNPITAGVLGVFALSAYALAWRRGLTAVVWVANVAAVLVALALLIATHDLVPFITALLCMALASEVAAARKRWLRLRAVAAVAADLAACLLIYIYSRPEGVPPAYRSVPAPLLLGLGCSLFLIHAPSMVFRTMRLRGKITAFEIGQTSVAFLLAAVSLFCFRGVGAAVIGAICLLFSAACYAAAYAYFDYFQERRNHYVYGLWSAVLFLAGSFLCLPPRLLSIVLSVAAVLATLLGVHASRLKLQFHGLAYLTAAVCASGVLDYAGGLLAGTYREPDWLVWFFAPIPVVCYAIASRVQSKMRRQRLLQLVSAIFATGTIIMSLISILVWLAAHRMTMGPSQVAVVRTLVTCFAALVLAFSSARFRRSEFAWIAYGILVLVALMLMYEELQHGNASCTAVSVFIYAVALIFVPRLVRIGYGSQAEGSACAMQYSEEEAVAEESAG